MLPIKLNKIILFVLLTFIFLWPQKSSAQVIEQINQFSADINIDQNGTIEVVEEISYHFSYPRHGIYRYLPYRYEDKDKKQYFDLQYQFLEVTQDGQKAQYTKSRQSGNWVLKIGDSDKTISGTHLYKIRYRVKYALSYFENYDELYWNITGSDWSVPIKLVTAKINFNKIIGEENVEVKCFAQNTDSDCQIKKNDQGVEFNSSELITVAVNFPKNIVAKIDRPYRKILPFIHYAYNSGWFLLLPILFLFFMIWKWWQVGRDPKGRTTIAPEFSIPDKLGPAQMGVILDEQAGNREISATFISLIFKGYVKIEEVKTKGLFKRKDYKLTLLKRDFSGLDTYEKNLLEAFFVDWDEIMLSALKRKTDSKIKQNLDSAKEAMYSSVAAGGYFVKSPQSVRSLYLGIGIGVLILGFGLIIVSGVFNIFSITFSVAIMLVGLIYASFSRAMPQKTRKGVLVREKILGFKMYMEKAEKYRSKWQEKENMITEFLPYAVLFGITSEWLKQLKAIGINVERVFDHSPYYFIPIYSLDNIGTSFNDIGTKINSAASSFSSSSSGSSGGSFGGGFGGGGGGSW